MSTTSALLKGAASIRSQLATYQDSVRAFEYSNSAYTDSAFSTYQAYLRGRIKALNASGSITDASKSLSLTKALEGAVKSNVSASIQRENIQIMAGNGNLTDKYNVVAKQYIRAQSIGDLTLAQSLEGQAYSISQSIQLQAQQSADAAATLGKANAASIGGNVSNLQESLSQLNNDIKLTGAKNFDSVVKKWTQTNSAALEALGVKLPNQPNYFDVVHGIAGAIINHDSLAAKAYAPYDMGKAMSFANNAYDMANGIGSLSTLAGDKTVPEILRAAANPNQFVYNPSEGKFLQTQAIGHQMVQQYDINGRPTGMALQPVYSGQLGDTTFQTHAVNATTGLPQKITDTGIHTAVLQPDQISLINKLGLKFDNSNHNQIGSSGVSVSATSNAPAWIKNVLGDNGATNLFNTPQGLQFTFNAKNGTGLSTYTVISDSTGKLGLAEESNTGSHILNGQYGFDPLGISQSSQKASYLDVFKAGLTNFAGIYGGVNPGNSTTHLLDNSNPIGPPTPIGPTGAPIGAAQLAKLPPLAPIRITAPAPVPVHVGVPTAPHTVSVGGGNNGLQNGRGYTGVSVGGSGGLQ